MKQKEIIQLSIAGIIFLVAGIFIFGQLSGGKSSSAKGKYTYEDVRPLTSKYSVELLQKISDTDKVKDFYLPPDLKSGIGNQEPFKPAE